MPTSPAARVALFLAACIAGAPAGAMEPWKLLADTRKETPQPPWPQGDERGMANQIGPATWARCAWHIAQRKARSYELSSVRTGADAPGTRIDSLGTGIEKAPPIVASAVLLDARAHAGDPLTRSDIEAMLRAQGLRKRGIQYGDVVYVYTGWSGAAPAPGLSADAIDYLAERRVVAVGMDAPFADPAPADRIAQRGIHPVERAKLDELARDRVWTSCTLILPLRDEGAAGAPVRPVAIGVPEQ